MSTETPEYIKGMISGGFLVMFLYMFVICKLYNK